MLYALGIGFGRDPLNEAELPFVYENGLKTIPTLSTVVAWGSAIIGRTGINYLMVAAWRAAAHHAQAAADRGRDHSPTSASPALSTRARTRARCIIIEKDIAPEGHGREALHA